MLLSVSALAIAASFGTFVSAVPRGHHEPPAHTTSTLCYTLKGWKPTKHVWTSYTTTTTPCTSTVTSTTTVTTTLVPVTGTVTVTSTSTVSTDSTSTVPTPATFLPVQTTFPEGTYSGAGGPEYQRKRDLDVLGIDIDIGGGDYESGGFVPGPKYPNRVDCKKWVPSPRCKTTTTTITSTSTVTPAESYTTVTDSTTSTSITSSTTVYAACATNNFIDGVAGQPAGQGIANVRPAPYGGDYPAYAYLSASDAYQCCVACLTFQTYAGVVWVWDTENIVCGCGLLASATCPATGQVGNPSEVIEGDYQLITGNLPCGEIDMAVD